MKINKLLLCAVFAVSTMWLTSCLNGSNSETYSNAYGYVATSSGVTYVNTSSGYSVTWDGISSSELEAGQCIKLSFGIDYTTSGSFYLAQNPSISDPLDSYTLTAGDPISVIDSNFVTAASVNMYASTSFFGDNWFLSLTTKVYKGVTVEPEFYYPTTIADDFDVDADSVVVNIRLVKSGTATATTTTSTTSELVVDLTPIRILFAADASYAGQYIPIYFRYYSALTTKAHTTKSVLYIPS
ncbi:MAG: hypothetical protein H6Q14_1490 [Bacteroidetes bacterium]|jgi:hypothetical protein|nr:hypothetical protein [Bacteroidota bacterium]